MGTSICILACQTVQAELERLLPENISRQYLPYGLHDTPEKLRLELRGKLAGVDAETVILGYGLCSNGVVGLSPCKGQRLVIPRAHDCISLLLGSRKTYHQRFVKCPGTIYLSKGWIDARGDPLSEYEKYVARYGEEIALWAIEEEYKNYKKVCLIDTGVGDMDKYRLYAKKVAALLKKPYEETTGEDTYFQKLLDPNQWDEDILVIHHPGEIRQSMFL